MHQGESTSFVFYILIWHPGCSRLSLHHLWKQQYITYDYGIEIKVEKYYYITSCIDNV